MYLTVGGGSHTANWSGIDSSWGRGGGGRGDCIVPVTSYDGDQKSKIEIRKLKKHQMTEYICDISMMISGKSDLI